ncbi:MAG: hypothetical protein K1060chlam1_00007 [Candidatus Anoxychlamydiales bacterium]|nr:hypothetical protein [Candidatus Anoxychlamydiales bacterium]
MGNTPAVQRIEELDEKERSKRIQRAYDPLIEHSDVEYGAKPEFRLKSAAATTIQKAPEAHPNEPFDISSTATPTSKKTLPEIASSKELISIAPTKDPKKSSSTTALGYEIVKAIERNEEIVRGISDILVNNIKDKNKLIVELTKEEQEKLNELLKQLRKNENADTVKSILNVLTASSAIVVGSVLLAPAATTAVATSPLWGALLIASGVTNLISNEILPRIDGFEKIASFFTSDENKKQDLAENIQTTTTITSTILSITSAIATSPLLGSVLKWSEGVKILDIGLGLASGAANFTKDVGEYQYKSAESAQTLIEDKLKQEKNDLENDHQSMKSALDVQKAFNTISANIIHTLNEVSEKDSRGKRTLNSNIQFELANTAAESIKALNANLSHRFIQIYNSRLESKEATLQTANSQKWQAIPHGFSAAISLTCIIAASVLKAQNSKWAMLPDALATSGPKVADLITNLQNKTITIATDRARSAEFEKQTKSATKDLIGSTIARTVEISSRLIQTAGAA